MTKIKHSGKKVSSVMVSTDAAQVPKEQLMFGDDFNGLIELRELVRYSLQNHQRLYDPNGALKVNIVVEDFRLPHTSPHRMLSKGDLVLAGVKLMEGPTTLAEFPIRVHLTPAQQHMSKTRRADKLLSLLSKQIAAQVGRVEIEGVELDPGQDSPRKVSEEKIMPQDPPTTLSSSSTEAKLVSKCRVEQILQMQKIGLSEGQIKSACDP